MATRSWSFSSDQPELPVEVLLATVADLEHCRFHLLAGREKGDRLRHAHARDVAVDGLARKMLEHPREMRSIAIDGISNRSERQSFGITLLDDRDRM